MSTIIFKINATQLKPVQPVKYVMLTFLPMLAPLLLEVKEYFTLLEVQAIKSLLV